MKENKGVTLVELMVVVILAGIMASFALPSYTKLVTKTKIQNAYRDAYAISAAQAIYKAKNGTFWPTDTGVNHGIPAINANLKLNILPDSAYNSFHCFGTAGGYICDILIAGSGDIVHVAIRSGDVKPTCHTTFTTQKLCP